VPTPRSSAQDAFLFGNEAGEQIGSIKTARPDSLTQRGVFHLDEPLVLPDYQTLRKATAS